MNMDAVFQKTRELGDALMESEAFQQMKDAEQRAMQDPEAAATLSAYLEKRAQLESMVASDDFDASEMKKVSGEMDELQQRLQMIDAVVKMIEARDSFSQLMGQVNQVLQFMITGQLEGENCTGSCSTCGGSCHKN